MILYQNRTSEFVRDVISNRIADLMQAAHVAQAGCSASIYEYRSWQNSSQHMKNVIQEADLSDCMISLEWEVPYNNNRIDCLLFGLGSNNAANVVLIELKQWSEVKPLDEEGNFLETITGGASRRVAHPCQQVGGYHDHLIFFLEVFDAEDPLGLFSCAYCHNYRYEGSTGLFDPAYRPLMEQYPLYAKGDVQALVNRLKELLGSGRGLEIFNRFRMSRIRPSKKLLDHAADMIRGEPTFSLLQEQIVAKNLVMSKIRKANKYGDKAVIVVQGGPGTGKSVIAVHLLAELAEKGKRVFFGCKSKPFLTALQKKVGKKAKLLFSNLYRFVPAKVRENELDVLLVDEAHRIQNSSNFQYTRKEHRTDMTQTEQLIRCARTSVFFIDDKQNVRSQEIGSTSLIMEYAARYEATCDLVRLESQFRCGGSNGYLDWVDSVLGYDAADRVLTSTDEYDVRIFDSPQSLYDVILEKERAKPGSARLVAGYCWPWSDPNPDGTLVDDVVIGDFAMPWEARDGFKLKEGIPKWYEWAFRTEGVGQVGCIYTAQGFEFDYIGLIVGDDIRFDPERGKLVGNPGATCDSTLPKDPDDFLTYVRNIYRVLMTRGMQGCYMYFVNKDTEHYFHEMIDCSVFTAPVMQPEHELVPYINALPLLDIRTVADSGYEALGGLFTEGVEQTWVSLPGGPFPRDRFLVRAEGDSMEPLIPDGALCRFRLDPGGSRNGKIVLCLIEGYAGEAPLALIKRYYSIRVGALDSELGEALEIILQSVNEEHAPIKLAPREQLRILGVFEAVVEENESSIL